MVDVQTYEEYWKVTLAYTDIHSNKFRKTLKIMRDFIYNKKQIHTEEDLIQKTNICRITNKNFDFLYTISENIRRLCSLVFALRNLSVRSS